MKIIKNRGKLLVTLFLCSCFFLPSVAATVASSSHTNQKQIVLPQKATDATPQIADISRNSSKTIYVDDDNQDGPWDGSLQHPWPHIQYGLDAANPGDTVFVFSGVYEFWWDVLLTKPDVKLVGEDRDTTKILLIITQQGAPSAEPIKFLADRITLSGFTIQTTPYIRPMFYKMIYITTNGNHVNNVKVLLELSYSEEVYAWDGWSEYGVYLSGASSNVIQNVELTEWIAWGGIALTDGSNNNVISDNIINDNGELPEDTPFFLGDGIYMSDSSRNTLSGNIITPGTSDPYRGIGNGMNIVDSSENIIRNNRIISVGYNGMAFDHSSTNRIIGNRIENYAEYGGVAMYEENHQNQFSRNTIINTWNYAISGSTTSTDNLLYHNNIMVFLTSAYDEGLNHWDHGYHDGGNYWIDYTGDDTNGDGIGEDPYTIPPGEQNADNFPLMNINGWTNTPPTQPSGPQPSNGAVNIPILTELRWSGIDPDFDDVVTFDVYLAKTNPPTKLVSNQSMTTFTPSLLEHNTQYYWKIIAWDSANTKVESPIWSFTTEPEPDNTDPVLIIMTPENALYFMKNKLINTFKPIIIGSIDIEVDAVDEQSGIRVVEFYLDDVLLGNDTSAPYGKAWTEQTPLHFRHTIRIVVYDRAGNSASETRDVLRFL